MVLNFSKAEQFLGVYVISFCKITNMEKLMKTNLNAEEKSNKNLL